MIPSTSVLGALAELARLGRHRDAQTTLARTELWPKEVMAHHQLVRATELVRHAKATVPFYRDRLPDVPLDATLDAEAWRALPTLSRGDIQDHFAELATSSTDEAHRIAHESTTSGSSGRPVTTRVGTLATAMDVTLGLRHHLWHKRDVRLKSAAIRGYKKDVADPPHGKREARWAPTAASGPAVLLDVRASLDEQLDWLVREAPGYLGTLPTNALALLERAEERGVRLPSLREVIVLGEVIPAELRSVAERAWGVPVSDAYSTGELGFVSFDCPERRGHHVQAEHVLVEVLRDDGAPCGPGETGRVVITALHAFPQPMIRYDLGDYAVVSATGDCPCGRKLPLLDGIVGRVRNMLRLPGGDRTWPVFGGNAFSKLAPVRQFRLVQRSLERLTLQLVVSRPLTPLEEAALRGEVIRVLRHPFALDFEYRDTIPRAPGGKYEEFLCEVRAP